MSDDLQCAAVSDDLQSAAVSDDLQCAAVSDDFEAQLECENAAVARRGSGAARSMRKNAAVSAIWRCPTT